MFFREQMGFRDDQIAMIVRGKAVAKVLPFKTPAYWSWPQAMPTTPMVGQ
jgi:hypothetical protein